MFQVSKLWLEPVSGAWWRLGQVLSAYGMYRAGFRCLEKAKAGFRCLGYG